MEYFTESDDKAEVCVFYRERIQSDIPLEAPHLKKMSHESYPLFPGSEDDIYSYHPRNGYGFGKKLGAGGGKTCSEKFCKDMGG